MPSSSSGCCTGAYRTELLALVDVLRDRRAVLAVVVLRRVVTDEEQVARDRNRCASVDEPVRHVDVVRIEQGRARATRESRLRRDVRLRVERLRRRIDRVVLVARHVGPLERVDAAREVQADRIAVHRNREADAGGEDLILHDLIRRVGRTVDHAAVRVRPQLLQALVLRVRRERQVAVAAHIHWRSGARSDWQPE